MEIDAATIASHMFGAYLIGWCVGYTIHIVKRFMEFI